MAVYLSERQQDRAPLGLQRWQCLPEPDTRQTSNPTSICACYGNDAVTSRNDALTMLERDQKWSTETVVWWMPPC